MTSGKKRKQTSKGRDRPHRPNEAARTLSCPKSNRVPFQDSSNCETCERVCAMRGSKTRSIERNNGQEWMEVLHEARLNSNDGESNNLPCLSFDSYLYDDSNFQFEFKYVITIISAKRISKLVACMRVCPDEKKSLHGYLFPSWIYSNDSIFIRFSREF